MTKTLLVGWDAACWEYLRPLLQAGRLPALQKLIDTGISGTLQSTMPPWTPTAWASIVTGKNPGKHGIFDMLWKRPGTYEFSPVNASLRRGTPFWTRLNQQGIRTGLVNVPFTYPPAPLDGFMVCGFGTPASISQIAYPQEAQQRVHSRFPDFKPEVEAEVLRTAPPQEIFRVEQKQQQQFVEIALDLAGRYPVDVLVINLMFPDHANHKMPEMEQVYAAYERTDADLARLIETYQPDNVMLISDHGSSRLKGDFWLDAWLRDRGYIVALQSQPAERAAALNWLLLQLFREHYGWSGWWEKVFRRVAKESLLRLPDWLNGPLWDRLENTFPRAREFVALNGRPDYAASTVFPGSVYAGLLYLNVVGREPHGIVPPEERAALAARLAGELRHIKEPETGRQLFSNVYTAEEIYSGAALPHAPDLILDAYDCGWNIRAGKYTSHPGPVVDGYFFQQASHRDFGWHSREGIFVFSGQAFEQTGNSSPAGKLVDIPATLLHIYGVPIPEDYDGQVITELLSLTLRQAPLAYQQGDGELEVEEKTYESEEAEILFDHLRALGYLD